MNYEQAFRSCVIPSHLHLYVEIDSNEYGVWLARPTSHPELKKYYKHTVAQFYKYQSSMLIDCELCWKRSTKKNIHIRNDCYAWNREKFYKNTDDCRDPYDGLLCTGCWNRVRAVLKKQREVEQIERLINKLNSERKKWQRSQALAS